MCLSKESSGRSRTSKLSRRSLLGAAALAAAGKANSAPAAHIIDTHTHFYDPTRPQGVPWPPKEEKLLYRPVLPPEFRELTQPLGIRGTIVVEASPWLEDNQWVLDLAKKHPVIVGVVGHLEPGQPEFPHHLERFSKNPLFRGIRLNRSKLTSIASGVGDARFLEDLKRLAGAGLEMDVVGGPAMLGDLVRLTDKAPKLRVVIDHLPFDPPAETAARTAYEKALSELGRRSQVYAKVSNVLRRSGDHVRTDLEAYRPALEQLWELFGADRLVYGSNWPVSNRIAPYGAVLKVVQEFFAGKGRAAAENYFWKNSLAAYRWRA